MKRALFVIPALLLLLTFSVMPLFTMMGLSLYRTNYITWEYVGVSNYLAIFTDADFLSQTVNTFLLGFMQSGMVMVFCIGMASATFWLSKKWQDFGRFALYLPVFTSGIVMAFVWRWIYNTESGLINGLLGTHIDFFSNRLIGLFCIALPLVLTNSGGVYLITLNGYNSINKEHIEAAQCEGATNFQVFRYIMSPIIKKLLLFQSMICLIGSFQVVETIFLLAPYNHIANLMFGAYNDSFNMGHYGYGAAKSIILIAIIIIVSKVKGKIEGTNANY